MTKSSSVVSITYLLRLDKMTASNAKPLGEGRGPAIRIENLCSSALSGCVMKEFQSPNLIYRTTAACHDAIAPQIMTAALVHAYLERT